MDPIVMTKVTSGAAYVSSGATLYFGLTMNELGVAVGIVATIVTVIMNWYFKREHLKIARQQLDLKISVGEGE